MGNTRYRATVPRRNHQRTAPARTEPLFAYQEFLQTVQDIKALRARFEKEHLGLLRKMEEKVDRYVSTIRKGDTGPQGPQGPRGESVQGPPGARGPQGERGPRGADGNTPDTGKIVAQVLKKAVKELPKEEDILKQVIDAVTKSTEDRLEKMQTTLRNLTSRAGLGGGMGTIKYFKFTGDGSTTEFTLPDTPTQEGNAVFAFSSGQRLHNTEHFTVAANSKVLALTYTPHDGEIIDGWIIT